MEEDVERGTKNNWGYFEKHTHTEQQKLLLIV